MLKRPLLLTTLALFVHTAAAEQCLLPQLSTQAEGYVEAVPDIAVVNVTISHTAKTLAEAKRQVDTIGNGVIRAADLHGIGKDDLQASRIQAAPEYDWSGGQRVLRGQQVSRQFELKLRDIDRYGALVQALADAEVTRIDGIRTEFSKPDQLEEKALQQAIANVRSKASGIAKGFDRKVKDVINISESGGAPGPGPYELRASFAKAQMADAGGEAALTVGKQRIVKSVAATFRLDGACIER